jgi:hypothetical protein
MHWDSFVLVVGTQKANIGVRLRPKLEVVGVVKSFRCAWGGGRNAVLCTRRGIAQS